MGIRNATPAMENRFSTMTEVAMCLGLTTRRRSGAPRNSSKGSPARWSYSTAHRQLPRNRRRGHGPPVAVFSA